MMRLGHTNCYTGERREGGRRWLHRGSEAERYPEAGGGLTVGLGPGRWRKLAPDSWEALADQVKASIRAKVEHPFLDVKQLFGYAKLRYRGLAKDQERLALLLGLSNLKRAHVFPAG